MDPDLGQPLERVPGNRRLPYLALAAFLAVIVVMVAQPWAEPRTPGPGAITGTSDPQSPAPSSGDRPTMSPGPPTARPATPPAATPAPPRADRPLVLDIREFDAVLASGEYVGATLLVEGRIVDEPGRGRWSCDGRPYLCPYGLLQGVELGQARRPLIVQARHTARPATHEGPHAAGSESWTWEPPPMPVEGTLALRIHGRYSVEYLGQPLLRPDGAGQRWTVDLLRDVDPGSVGVDRLVLIPGWLAIHAAARPACDFDGWDGELPDLSCGSQAWLAPPELDLDDLPSDGLLPLAPDAGTVAHALGKGPGAAGWLAPEGVFALAPRLWSGCPQSSECWQWQALGMLAPEGALAAIPPRPDSTPTPDDGWSVIAEGWREQVAFSPDGRWRLRWDERAADLVDQSDGATLRAYSVGDELGAGRLQGVMWLDDERFLLTIARPWPDPTSSRSPRSALGTLLGTVGREGLREVSIPRGRDSDGPDVPLGLANGRGAVAFVDTDTTTDGCRGSPCTTFTIWTPLGTSRQLDGVPVAWSRAGDRLAVVHDTERAGTGASRPGTGAGQPWALGWIEVLSWPGLETIYANRELLSEEVHTGFDPTGRYLAFMYGDGGIADLETGRHVLVEGHWVNQPVWDAAGRLIVMRDGGTVAALDTAGVERQRWTAVGDYIVGTLDGSTVAVNWWGDPPIGPVGAFTVLRDDRSFEVALPEDMLGTFVYPSLTPDGSHLVVSVRDGRWTLMRRLDDAAP